MNKAILTVAVIILVAFSAQSVVAASARCVVTEIEGDTIILECGKNPKGFAKGDAVKLKSSKKERIEGC